MFPIFAGNSASTGYNLTRSVRLRSSASAYLSRTMTAGTSVQKGTQSFWVKRGALATTMNVGMCAEAATYPSGGAYNVIQFTSSDTLNVQCYNGTSFDLNLITTQVFRDPSASYHIVVAWDTTQATAANRAIVYVNGTQVTAFSTATYPAQNTNFTGWGASNFYTIGADKNNSNVLVRFFDGYLAEFNYVDGQQLAVTSFGSTNALTGVWQPARYTGSYGTNGFYLPFTDNSALTTSSNVGLGKDFSGNGNYFTTNNISITAGVTYDSMTDVPTLTSATASNFATLNPLRPTGSGGFSNGNLTGTGETGAIVRGLCSTIVLPWTGKWYAEVVFASHPNNWCGVTANDFLAADINTAGQMSVLYYATTGNKWVNGTNSAYGASYTTETIGIAFDGAAGTITFYKSNVSQGAITLPSSTVQYVFCQANAAAAAIAANWNFGQQPFTYTPPTGFVALNTFNITAGTVTTSGSFTGNLSADGPFVYLNGVPTAMTINGNAVTFGTNVDKLANGFKVRSASALYNLVTSNTYSVTTNGAVFKNANAQGNP